MGAWSPTRSRIGKASRYHGRMKRVLTALLLAGGFAAGAGAADETSETRAARYYAQGLEQPLLRMREGAMLVQACQGRLRRACEKEQIELATGNHVLVLLDALTLFPQRLDGDPLASIAKPRDLRQKIQGTSAALLQTAGEYDDKLFARYGATLAACPYEIPTTYSESLETLVQLDLGSFQALGPEVTATAARIADETTSLAEKWRQSPIEDCLAARNLGENLMELMAFKLQPWSPESAPVYDHELTFDQPKKEAPPAKSPARDRELAHAVAGNFVAVVATELQLRVFPETAPRIKALADQAGFPSED